MADLEAILGDLAAEGDDVAALVADLDAAEWAQPTPAPGWSIAHQIAHLNWTDEVSEVSARDPEAFQAIVKQAWSNPSGFVDVAAEERAQTPPADLLARWQSGRAALNDALRDVALGRKLDWFGPPMSPASMATARLMETWAHGQDIADAVGASRAPTARLRNVAHLGVRTRNFAYSVHNEQPPAEDFRVELTAPDGTTWAWGPDESTQRIVGPALDFCLLVTQRRHLDDLALQVTGDDARHWTTIAQVFAGTPGAGRAATGASA
ncbi:TIGR03084 family metal-binding protein [Antrihabitans cavernicola]|uniref:TIGR03084 family protein n=1 Tax=Antrihabitans cavernicola TaxID=2495913 RepID=A0A5A7S7Z8_9NOCA|nr:TIGR03084 family metal-binding protein [Spelaeibacter cavernicola]KAA0021329.1 TIGR03084 family protein [Spelaeibacter cavernicola]